MKLKTNTLIAFLGLLLMIIVLGMDGGCGEKIVATNYYYYPNWTPDGKIICTRKYDESKDLGFGKYAPVKTEYYITVMDEDGSNEHDIKQINEIAKISYSPLGNYIAYTEGNYIKIIQPNGTDVSSIDCGATVDSLDWSPDEVRVVYGITTSTTSEIYVRDKNGDNKKFIKSGIDVTWKYGGKIVLSASTTLDVYTRIHAIDASDLTSVLIYANAVGNMVTINPILTSEVFYHGSSNTLQKIDISDVKNEPVTLQEDFRYWHPKISSDGSRIIYGKGDDTGIWITNIDGTNLKQIR